MDNPAAAAAPHALVLDTGAFVSLPDSFFLAPDHLSNPVLYTTERVLAEVRDPVARAKLAKLDHARLTIRTPSDESIARVIQFSKKTGDYTSLSLTDLQILALTCMIEMEHNGLKFLRSDPAGQMARRNKQGAPKAPSATPDTARLVDGVETSCERPMQPTEGQRTRTQRRRTQRKAASVRTRVAQDDVAGDACVEFSEKHRAGDKAWKSVPPTLSNSALDIEASSVGAFEDDGIGWINEENLDARMAQDVGSLLCENGTASRIMVGCMTTDFAMQNVLLQIGLQLVSPDNGVRVIRELRRFIKRCEACFKTTLQLEKEFCPHCGNHTLAKIPYTVDQQGCVNVRYDPSRQPKLRGTKYPLPLPRGGRNNNDIILAEDQLIMRSTRQQTKQVDVFDPSTGYNAGATHNPDRSLIVGYGRRNPNQVGRRTGNRK